MRLSFLAVLPLVVACAASIDPAMRASIDQQVAALKPSDQVYPAPTTKTPMPLSPGQWTKIKLVDKSGRPSFMTYKVIGQEGDASWIEMVTESYSGRTVIKMLVAYGDRTDPKQVDIRHAIAKIRDNAPIDYQGPMLAIVQGTFKEVAKGLVVQWEGLPQETKKVPAGVFTDAYKADTEVSFYGFSSRAKVWSHSAVPVQGLVHSENEDGSTLDLVDFGLSGATSEL
ncbi:MAG: hypothetical protein FWD17_07835 [Polyangiaceae bacterium]|nr:hypothetical protein [Polyangiaceae bacterium]